MVFRRIIDNPILVTVAVLLVTLMGILAVLRVPVQLIPDLDVRVVTIITRWPGATPQDVEREILIEQEEYLREVTGVDRMTSRASMGRAEIELEFPFGTDIDDVLIRIQNALTQVPGYPENVDEPRLVANSYSDNPFLYFGIKPLPGYNVDINELFDFVDDNVRVPVSRVDGVSDVDMWGGVERQVRIYVDPRQLAERGISISELRNAIRSRNRDVSGGDLDTGKRRYVMRTIGRFRDIDEINDLVIARRGDALVRLRDVGYAELDFAEARSRSYMNDEPVLVMRMRREPGSNIVGVRDAIADEMKRLDETVLKDVGLTAQMFVDDAKYVEDAVKVVRQNLIIGALLAISVLFFFLRSWRTTVIGAIGIPVCLVAAFLGLLLTGRTINVISLAGVAFAIGMTLDNSIVVLENIHRHRMRGLDRAQAAERGVSEVWKAVLASTLTTVFVFLPVLFVEEQAGQLYSDIAVAISASILMSMIVATTVVPVGARYLGGFRSAPDDVAGGERGVHFREKVLKAVRATSAGRANQLVTLAVAAALTFFIIGFLTPKAEYLPEGEEPKAFASAFAPPGYNMQEVGVIAAEIREFLAPHVGADPELYEAGETDFPPIEVAMQFYNEERVRTIMPTIDPGHIDDLIERFSAELERFPAMRSFVTRGSIFSGNSGGTRSINIDVSGPSIPELYAAAQAIVLEAGEVFKNPQVRSEPSGLALAQPFLEIRPDWERAAELDVSAADLGYFVWAYSDGAYVDEFFLDDDKIDMYLYSTEGTISHPEDISGLYLYSSAGAAVPLSSVARVTETTSVDSIRRVDADRTVTVSIIPPRSVPLEVGVETVEEQILGALRERGDIGPRITTQLSGASDQLDATRQALVSNFVVALMIVYLLLVAILSHWGYPLVIMTTVPVGVSGGIAGLWLLNAVGGQLGLIGLEPLQQPFDMITMLGFLVLIGTVVNNPILIVERTMRNVRDEGMAPAAAVEEAVSTRLRPIMMSTITTVLGLSPLVLLPGAGTELYRGLGAVVMFGILYSAAVTLFFLPSLLALVFGLRERFMARPGRVRPELPGA
jgi:multidrug efflux pump subunit AcrB